MKIYSFTVENKWLNISWDHGWGNGYVAIPPEHPLYGKHYNDKIHLKNGNKVRFNGNYIGLLVASCEKENDVFPLSLLINVHCGITFSDSVNSMKYAPSHIPKDYWVFGFDTAHAGDNQTNWSKEKVRKETNKFKRIMENIDKLLN